MFSLLENDKTDERGRWFLSGAPEPVASLNIRIDHPEFLRKRFPLQAGTDAKYQLTRGRTIRGTVRDSNGKPVAGAVLHPGDDRWGSGKPEARTDEDGTYELKGLEPVATVLTVTAPHLTPQTQSVPLSGPDATLDFQLSKGHTIRFRAVDRHGEPAPGVRFVADTWKGLRTLEWRGTTDEQW